MYSTAPYLSTVFRIRVDLLGTKVTSELIFSDSSRVFPWSSRLILSFCIFEPLVTSFQLTFTFSNSSFALAILTISSLSALVRGATSFNETVISLPFGMSLADSLGWHTRDLLHSLQGRFNYTGPGELNQVGTDVPKVD